MNSYAGKTCVVFGGAGAIGSRLCQRLLGQAEEVLVMDNLSSGFQWLLPRVIDDNVHFVKGDIVNDLKLVGRPHGCVVFHLAAHFANQNSVDHPFDDLRTNGEGTLRVLEWAAGEAERVVFASAGCAAGHEDTPYQIHKSLGEAYCRYFFGRVPTVVCRFHNSYGPGEVPGLYRNVIPNWIWAAMHDQPLIVYGDGTHTRDFIYVDDLVDGMMDVYPSLTPCELGTGRLTTTAALAQAVLKITASKSQISFEPSRRWDHPGRAAAGALRAGPGLVPLNIGLKKTYQWFQDNYEKIKESVR